MCKRKLNNRGFSLIELVVCVALLAIVVVPLMQAFTRSTDYYAASKEKGEATASAQNIRETIEAFSVDNILAGNEDFMNMTGAQSCNVEGTDVVMSGIKSGSGTYDARVHFDSDSDDVVRNINSKEIAKYSKLNSSFNQPLDYNPDITSSNTYKAKHNINEDTRRRRVIVIDVRTSETDEGEIAVKTTVTFQYHYYDDCPHYGSRVTRDAFRSILDNCIAQSYELDEVTIPSYDEEFNFRLLYYPFFENPDAHDTIVSFIDLPSSSSSKMLKYNLILVKMTPMIREDGAWKTVTNTEATSTTVPNSGYNSPKPTFAQADQTYALDLYECHPAYYDNINTYHCDSAGNWINTTFTNAKKRIFSEGMNNAFNLTVYRCRNVAVTDDKISNFTTLRLTIPSSLEEYVDSHGAIVKSEADARFYNVTVRVYKQGHIDDNQYLLFTLNTKKLN